MGRQAAWESETGSCAVQMETVFVLTVEIE